MAKGGPITVNGDLNASGRGAQLIYAKDNIAVIGNASVEVSFYSPTHMEFAKYGICSEAGGGLSEGQAQRIAIARALLRDRSIMLFDEATSALDTETERQLLENILSDKHKTIIFITHRLAVVDYCDQVLRIE